MPHRGNGYTNGERSTYDLRLVERRCVWLEEHEAFAAVRKREEKEGWRAVDKLINDFSRALILQRDRDEALREGHGDGMAEAAAVA